MSLSLSLSLSVRVCLSEYASSIVQQRSHRSGARSSNDVSLVALLCFGRKKQQVESSTAAAAAQSKEWACIRFGRLSDCCTFEALSPRVGGWVGG